MTSAFSIRNASRRSSSLQRSCDVRCPPVERPVCARLVYSGSHRHRTVYVLMVNKCEMNYVKCYEGLEAAVVPMKYCGHGNLLKTGSQRSKRQIESDEITEKLHNVQEHEAEAEGSAAGDEDIAIPADNSPDTASAEESAVQGPDSEYDLPPDAADPNIQENENPHIYADGDGANDGGSYEGMYNGEGDGVITGEGNYNGVNNGGTGYDGVNNGEGSYEGLNNGESDGVNNGGGGYEGLNNGEAAYDGLNDGDVVNNGGGNYNGVNNGVMGYGGGGYDKPMDESNLLIDDKDYEPDASFDEDIYAEDFDDGKQTLDVGSDVDMGQYQAQCPLACPARDVMVCARCEHGVLRTFLSTCHMRMFTCAHADEKLQLVSRAPCALSAPYLSATAPRGRMREPRDHDRALRYLRCRDLYTQQDRDDANRKCIFEDFETSATVPHAVDGNY